MEYIRPHAVVALIGLVTEVKIGIDRIKAIFLQLVGFDLVHQSYAASFLTEINHGASSLALYHLHREMKLFAAFAPLRAEYVAGHARRMNPDKHRILSSHITLDKGDMLQIIVFLAERDKPEMAVYGRHVHLLAYFHKRVVVQPESDEVAYAYKLEAPFVGAAAQFGKSCHGAVIAHDFHKCGDRLKAGKPRKIHSGLGVARALKYSAVLGVKRVDMAWTSECLRSRGRVRQSAYCCRTVLDRNTRGASFKFVDSNGKRRTQHRSVVIHLLRKPETGATVQRDRGAENAACILQHKIHILRSDLFSRYDEVSLVFTILVIHHNEKFSVPEILECILHPVEFYIIFHYFCYSMY